jgi:hypothetical protein
MIGAGKSNAAVVMAEEMYDNGLPWVAIDPKGDWWGVRASGDGQSPGLAVLVFGGEHADIPLEPTAGKLVADLIVDKRLTCVLDVSEMTKADQRRFLQDFADRLYTRNREPLHVFCEEADEYIPQMVRGETAKVVAAMERLVKRGRFRGVGVTLITQRSASLNKDVLTQTGTLIALRTTSPQDRKAVREWIDYHASYRGVIDELPSLANGEAWLSSPQFLSTLEQVKFRRRRTFDSGATPRVGVKARPPARLADVDVEAIASSMADTIERAKAEDPKELQKEIRQLKAEIARLQKETPEAVVERVEVPVLDPALVDRLHDVLDEIHVASTAVTGAVSPIVQALMRLGDYRQTSDVPTVQRLARVDQAKARMKERPTPPPAPRSAPTPLSHDGSGLTLGKAEKAILSVLAQYPQGRTHSQLALLTGYSPKASTISVALSKLRKLQFVTDSGLPQITDVGASVATVVPLPTGQDLIDYWLHHNVLGKAERLVLEALVDRYPDEVQWDELCEVTGYSPTASTVSVALSKLRKLELVQAFRASDTLMDLANV